MKKKPSGKVTVWAEHPLNPNITYKVYEKSIAPNSDGVHVLDLSGFGCDTGVKFLDEQVGDINNNQ